MENHMPVANKGLANLQPYLPGKPIDELERELGISEIVKLASNENPLGPSPVAVAAVDKELTQLTRYPDGGGYHLKNALSETLGVAHDQITLGNGSNDVLELAARAFIQEGDEVIFSEYAFCVYPMLVQALAAKPVETKALNWGHDLNAMLAAITDKTKAIMPVGIYGQTSDMKAICEIAKRHGSIPVIEDGAQSFGATHHG